MVNAQLRIALIAHGYGEHAGRYEHVARRLVDDLDAAVYAPDHRGHGRTDGATGTVADGEAITSEEVQRLLEDFP